MEFSYANIGSVFLVPLVWLGFFCRELFCASRRLTSDSYNDSGQ